jgi:hypothetical protein
MQEFSLERFAEDIHHRKTKEYFREVLSSYHNGNYRSAVVMLWSVAVCDVVYKLQSLIDIYEDAQAKTILDEITKKQIDEPRSSAWEVQLIKDVYEKTQLLDTAEYENLKYLQKQRHLSAHPVLNSERELHSPKKETVRALLRTTLEELLVKPPFYTQRILDELLEDVSESSAVLNSRSNVKKYVVSRYLSRTTPPVELNLIRSLWKLVFKVEDEDCSKNRFINLSVLDVLASRNEAALPDLLTGDKDYFGNVSPTGVPITYLVYFLAKRASLYDCLNDGARLKVQHCIQTDDVGRTLGWFVKSDLMVHGQDVETWIKSAERPDFKGRQFDALLGINDSAEWQARFCKIVSVYYTISHRYDQADGRFQDAIQKYIHLFDKDNLIFLIEKINGNSQCCGRGKAREDYQVIKERIHELYGDDFNYDAVPEFFRKVKA